MDRLAAKLGHRPATTLLTLLALALGRQIREMLPARMPDILGGVLLLTFATWNFYRERTGASGRPPVPTSRFADASIGGHRRDPFFVRCPLDQ